MSRRRVCTVLSSGRDAAEPQIRKTRARRPRRKMRKVAPPQIITGHGGREEREGEGVSLARRATRGGARRDANGLANIHFVRNFLDTFGR